MSTDEIAAVVAASSVAELSWLDAAGRPEVHGVVALVRNQRPVLAFTYAHEAIARRAALATRVSLALSEPRSTGAAFRPMLLTGRPVLTEDPDGRVFVSELVTQELRRYPPSRLFADSPLLMREHWWYLPRLLLEIEVDETEPLPQRVAPCDHVLVVARRAGPAVRVAGVREHAEGTLVLDLDGRPPEEGHAVLFGQEASFPDLERWSQWRYRGRWDGETFAVAERPARTGLAPVPGLIERWRRQRALERRCVAAIPRPRPGQGRK